MEIVAHHLQHEALKRTPPERDSFGRSAFNRYYYATFLEVKSCLATLRPEWSGDLAHATIPDVLRGKIKNELKKGSLKAQKASDFPVYKLCQRALSATEELAKLMEMGRMTRVAADYHPEIPVDFLAADDFQLNTISVRIAQGWPHNARHFLTTISSAWKQLHD